MTRRPAIIVLQARLASTRLPRKALRSIDGRTIVARCIERLLIARAAPVVLATTEGPEDDDLAAEGAGLGVSVVRGPAEDVLGRFVAVARAFPSEWLLRATADNPAVDVEAPARVLRALRTSGADYVIESGLPVGCAVEGMRTAALLDAADRTADPYDREHVTPFLRRIDSGYQVLQVAAPDPVRRPDLRFTIDTPSDFAYMSEVLARDAAPPRAGLNAIIANADRMAGGRQVA